jgi:phenylacetate-CoA ligase
VELTQVKDTEWISPDAMLSLQEQRLKQAVRWAYENSDFYRRKLDEAGVHPSEIKGLEDLVKLPFTDKEELRANYPLGLKAVPEEKIVRIHASSGTTGKKTVACYTQKDIDDWAEMMARCFRLAGLTPKDRIQITTGYGLWTAGVGFQLGAERLGAMAVPVGPGATDLQLELMLDLEVTAFCSTSSYALLLAEEVEKRGLREKLNLRVAIIGSERWSERMRKRIEDLLGIESFDIIGMTELYGPGVGIDCQAHEGIHYWSDYFIFEVVDPATGKPCPPGKEGELVATTLCREAMPLLRYRTRDITRLLPEPCPCGRAYFRIDRISGRTDDMVKVRGVNIFPGQIDDVLNGFPELGSEYQLIVTRTNGRDSLLLRVEKKREVASESEALARRVAERVKAVIGLTPEVEVLEYGSLPRSEKKAKRLLDLRES